jgi:hypothetical protein
MHQEISSTQPDPCKINAPKIQGTNSVIGFSASPTIYSESARRSKQSKIPGSSAQLAPRPPLRSDSIQVLHHGNGDGGEAKGETECAALYYCGEYGGRGGDWYV